MEQSWLDQVIESHKFYESPSRYYYWSALAAVSAIIKDHIYLDRGGLYKLYANVYILLYGDSGIKKGPAITAARRIVELLGNTRVINGRSTVEGIIKELGTIHTRQGQAPINDNCGFIVSSELSSSIVSSTQSLDTLTDLFDRMYNEGQWKYLLKASDSITLKKPTITWLAGTNESLFREFVPEKNLKGGLIGRMFVINEKEPNCINSLMWTPEVVPNYAKLAEGVRYLTNLSGPVLMQEDVKIAFNDWYVKFKTEVAPKLADDSGTVNRIDDSILKIAILISCARRGDMVITMEDIIEATKNVLPLLVPSKRISNNAKSNEVSSIEKRGLILRELANSEGYKANRITLLRKFTLKMDHEDLDKVIVFLEQNRVLVTESGGGSVNYRLKVEDPKVREYVDSFKK